MQRTRNGSRFPVAAAIVALCLSACVWGGVGCGTPPAETPEGSDDVPVEDDTAIGLGQGGRDLDGDVEPADHDIEVPPAP